MRVALLSDLHGNSIALDAVLRDAADQGGADEFCVLGDLVAHGPDPVGVLERIVELPGVRFVRGNTDRYVVTGDRPPPSVEDAKHDPKLVDVIVQIANGFSWTRGVVAQAGWFEWLVELPFEQRLALPDGTRILGVHASPVGDDRGLNAHATDEELAERLQGCSADVVFAGHTHTPFDRVVGDIRVVNLGSVSMPKGEDRRATYTILEARSDGYELHHRRVEYDLGAVVKAMEASTYPMPEWVASHFD